jgi:hypothetical protein
LSIVDRFLFARGARDALRELGYERSTLWWLRGNRS